MAVFTIISKKELEKFIQKYNIGSLISFEGVLEGIENTNYKITTSQNDYMLTIFEKRVNSVEIPFFINLKKHLAKKKFICPKPIKDKKGNYINFFNRKHCVIVSFLDGKKVTSVSNNHCKQVGRMLSLMHKKSKDYKEKRNNTMNYNQWRKIYLKIKKEKDNQFSILMPNIYKELCYLKKVWPKKLPTGIIHADVFQDNVFFLNNQFSGLIDFYFSCNDFFSYDIALTINAWCFDTHSNFKEKKFLNIIQGYEIFRKLTNMEKKYLSILLRGAAVRILLTRIHDYIFHPDSAYVEPKNPKEYLSILKFHQQNNISELL